MIVNSLRVSSAVILLLSVTAVVLIFFFVHCGRTTVIVNLLTTNRDTSPSQPQSTSGHNGVHKDQGNRSSSRWNACEDRFVKAYELYCKQSLHPQTSNVPLKYRNLSDAELSNHLCPCVPKHLCKYVCAWRFYDVINLHDSESVHFFCFFGKYA